MNFMYAEISLSRSACFFFQIPESSNRPSNDHRGGLVRGSSVIFSISYEKSTSSRISFSACSGDFTSVGPQDSGHYNESPFTGKARKRTQYNNIKASIYFHSPSASDIVLNCGLRSFKWILFVIWFLLNGDTSVPARSSASLELRCQNFLSSTSL